MSSPDYGVPLIAAATALTTGFGAAILKHRWDVASDKIRHAWDMKENERRWERERAERRREELKSAFNDYFSTRLGLQERLTMGRPIADEDAEKIVPLLHIFTGNTVQLKVLLPDDVFKSFAADTAAFVVWTNIMIDRKESGTFTTPPPDEEARRLAKRLLDT